MRKVSLRMPEETVEALEALLEDGTYPSRSEIIREAVRNLLDEREAADETDAAGDWTAAADAGGYQL